VATLSDIFSEETRYKMRTLKYAILGLVSRRPMTGYDIAKEFKEKELSNFWSAGHSQIYPELKKLVEEGRLEFEVAISGEVLEKKVYQITERGRRDFMKWLLRDEQMEPTAKDKFRLRMYFVENMPEADALMLLESQLTQRKEKLAYLERQEQEITDAPEYHSEEFGDYLVLKGAVLRERAYVEWLTLSISLVKKAMKK